MVVFHNVGLPPRGQTWTLTPLCHFARAVGSDLLFEIAHLMYKFGCKAPYLVHFTLLRMTDVGTPLEHQAELEEPVASTSILPDALQVEEATNETQSLEQKDESGKCGPADGEVITFEAPKSTLSKSQQRKLARQEKMAALKPERRAREKAAKKERRAEKRRLVDEEGADPYEIGLKKQKKPKKAEKFNANIVIDLGFDDKMSEKVGRRVIDYMHYGNTTIRPILA